MHCEQLFFVYINGVNSEYSLTGSPFLHHPCLFFLTVNRRLQYLLIEFIVDESLLEGSAKRRNTLLTSYMLVET